jgi:pyridoxamine 5'-phosphate oxidase-like protein
VHRRRGRLARALTFPEDTMNTLDALPVAEPLTSDGRVPTTLPWAEARERISQARWYWLGTIHPSGRPHIRPLLAVWMGDALYTTSSPRARKGRNLDRDGRCTVTVTTDDMHLVLEGDASKVTDPIALEAVAAAYRVKYDWPVTVINGAFDAPYGAPTAGLPPYQPYQIRPATVFGFANDPALGPASTCWRF